MESTPKSPFSLVKEVDPLAGKEGTVFDKPGPQGPPGGLSRGIPTDLAEIVRWLTNIVADESLLLDLCIDRTTEVIMYNWRKRAAGSDMMQEISPLHFVGAGIPAAVELYKQCLLAVNGRAEEYQKLVEKMQEERKRAKPASSILTP